MKHRVRPLRGWQMRDPLGGLVNAQGLAEGDECARCGIVIVSRLICGHWYLPCECGLPPELFTPRPPRFGAPI